jgi:outer membrane cobalamin receptor
MGKPSSKTDINMGDSNDRQPLFVIDGQKVGRNYPDVRDMVTTGQIKSVRLLKDSEASQYGSQSGFGVIEIITKGGDMKN